MKCKSDVELIKGLKKFEAGWGEVLIRERMYSFKNNINKVSK